MNTLNTNVIVLQAAATVTSAAVRAPFLFYASAQIAVTGAGAGTLQMQASNDDPQDGTAPQNWSNISGAAVTVTGAGAFLIPKTDLCYQYVRLVYTNTGTGTISVILKALGA